MLCAPFVYCRLGFEPVWEIIYNLLQFKKKHFPVSFFVEFAFSVTYQTGVNIYTIIFSLSHTHGKRKSIHWKGYINCKKHQKRHLPQTVRCVSSLKVCPGRVDAMGEIMLNVFPPTRRLELDQGLTKSN